MELEAINMSIVGRHIEPTQHTKEITIKKKRRRQDVKMLQLKCSRSTVVVPFIVHSANEFTTLHLN